MRELELPIFDEPYGRFLSTCAHLVTRVIYADILQADTVYLFAVYGKWDQDDLTKAEEKQYRDVLSALKNYHRQLAEEGDQP